MRKLLLPVLAAGALLFSTAAQADTANGVIKTVDAKAKTLALEDGSQYDLGKTVATKGLKSGMKVVVTFTTKDGKKTASKVVEDKPKAPPKKKS